MDRPPVALLGILTSCYGCAILKQIMGGDSMAFDQNRYIDEYKKEHYYRLFVHLPKEYREKLKTAAGEQTGGNVTRLVTNAIDEYLEKKK